jgi:hypothetical protein
MMTMTSYMSMHATCGTSALISCACLLFWPALKLWLGSHRASYQYSSQYVTGYVGPTATSIQGVPNLSKRRFRAPSTHKSGGPSTRKSSIQTASSDSALLPPSSSASRASHSTYAATWGRPEQPQASARNSTLHALDTKEALRRGGVA